MVKHFWAGICLGAAAVYAAPAVSQTESGGTAGPDKSGYTVFNPTPVEQMRGFCTDRPTKSNLPCTVDAGHFQYEADAINWTYAKAGGVQTNTYLYTNPTLKLGLTNTVDAELNIAPAERIFSNSAAGKSSIGGAGDLFLRTKLNIAGPEGGDFQLTALPFIKVPTAKPGIGNKAVEGGFIVPVSFALPRDFTLLFDPEIDVLRNALNRGRHANFQILANLSHALSESVTGYVELFGAVNNDPSDTLKQASLDLAVSWVVWDKAPNLQLDIGTNIGLTRDTPRIQAYAGISQRF
jgi:Putative MetA-pathway of phenol degradation